MHSRCQYASLYSHRLRPLLKHRPAFLALLISSSLRTGPFSRSFCRPLQILPSAYQLSRKRHPPLRSLPDMCTVVPSSDGDSLAEKQTSLSGLLVSFSSRAHAVGQLYVSPRLSESALETHRATQTSSVQLLSVHSGLYALSLSRLRVTLEGGSLFEEDKSVRLVSRTIQPSIYGGGGSNLRPAVCLSPV